MWFVVCLGLWVFGVGCGWGVAHEHYMLKRGEDYLRGGVDAIRFSRDDDRLHEGQVSHDPMNAP